VLVRERGQADLDGAEAEADGDRREHDRAHAGGSQRAQRPVSAGLLVRAPVARGRPPDERDRARQRARGAQHERGRRRSERDDDGGDERAGREQQLYRHRVQRERGRYQLVAWAQQLGPQGPERAADVRDREAADEAARDERHGRGARLRQPDQQPGRRSVEQRGGEQHPALPHTVDQPALRGRADRGADRERPVDEPRDGVRAARLGEVQDRRQRVEPVRQPGQHRRHQQRRDVLHPQDGGVAGATGHPLDAT
jgi:hypothetical protein